MGTTAMVRKRISGIMAQFVFPLSANYRQGKVAVFLLDKKLTGCKPICAYIVYRGITLFLFYADADIEV